MNDKMFSPKNKLLHIFHMIYIGKFIWFGPDKCCQENMKDNILSVPGWR